MSLVVRSFCRLADAAAPSAADPESFGPEPLGSPPMRTSVRSIARGCVGRDSVAGRMQACLLGGPEASPAVLSPFGKYCSCVFQMKEFSLAATRRIAENLSGGLLNRLHAAGGDVYTAASSGPAGIHENREMLCKRPVVGNGDSIHTIQSRFCLL